jgi:hypothetical protein
VLADATMARGDVPALLAVLVEVGRHGRACFDGARLACPPRPAARPQLIARPRSKRRKAWGSPASGVRTVLDDRLQRHSGQKVVTKDMHKSDSYIL